jgi:hypothetical protein
MLVLCSLLVIVNVGTAKATEAGYTIIEYFAANPVTVDGKWTTADEWLDAPNMTISPTAKWEYKIDYTAGILAMSFLIEFADNTNDAGDSWQICIDGSQDGGTAPQADDVKFEIEGHTTLTCFVGTGTAWAPTTPTGVTWKDSLVASSPNDNSPHYVLEVQIDKSTYGWGANPPPHGVRVACYDASNATQGWQSWPPTPETNPSRWGSISVIPEGLTVGVMLLLSTIAVIVSLRYFRKRPRIESPNQVKL